MLADFFTKPLQGNPFHIFWDNIMGIDPQLAPTMDHRSVLGLGMKEDTVDMGLGTEDTADTADGKNSLNDGAQDDSGWIMVKRAKHGHNSHSKTKGHSMTNCHSMTNSMTPCVCGIMTKIKAEQRAPK